MSLLHEFHQTIRQIGEAVAVPAIREVLLPAPALEEGKQDEFGFLVLADGSVGPFYTSLDDSFALLRGQFSQGSGYRGEDAIDLALSLGSSQMHINALALGAVNAISQHLMLRAGFDPTSITAPELLSDPPGSIGMVGYFGPVIERYLAEGYRITLVEKNPGRVPTGLGIEVSTNPAVLAGCDYVICTASALINNTLEEILDSVSKTSIFNLMGPSASCLPDPLFKNGVALVGGILIDDVECLRQAMQRGDSWGCCGRKYQLSRESYPGLACLLAAAAGGREIEHPV